MSGDQCVLISTLTVGWRLHGSSASLRNKCDVQLRRDESGVMKADTSSIPALCMLTTAIPPARPLARSPARPPERKIV
jgi:hypothetical protein